MGKIALYLIVVPFVIWTLEALRIDFLFKKGRVIKIKLFYVFLSLAFSYLIVNCLYDFAYYFNNF